CTPAGVIELLDRTGAKIEGANTVVLGRSNIVGLPVSLLLLGCNATVTVCHSRTQDIAAITRQADILVVAIGRTRYVTADMDFKSPPALLDAIQKRLDHGVFGYEWPTESLTNIIVERMARLYGWRIEPDWVVWMPGLVYGLNNVCRAVGTPGEDAIMFSPIYPPMLSAPVNQGLTVTTVELTLKRNSHIIAYEADFDRLEQAIQPQTVLFIHCHPHNPTGHEYTRAENLRLAETCARHNLVICSDEIHGDLLMDGIQHMPLAALAPEIAQHTITLMAPSKTFNMPSLDTSFAIIPNADLRRRVKHNAIGLHINAMGLAAVEAAYTECDDWLAEL
ncbi:MAG: aminotransferase class I/II-fold pyridoxal phosphate-dependent enzyme, partial [Chloroflexi bacterium]|nr:aminotransferase class I/II-fold pyridoxal phosphate-dependent enzyme [Chloroflexota bacterium]